MGLSLHETLCICFTWVYCRHSTQSLLIFYYYFLENLFCFFPPFIGKLQDSFSKYPYIFHLDSSISPALKIPNQLFFRMLLNLNLFGYFLKTRLRLIHFVEMLQMMMYSHLEFRTLKIRHIKSVCAFTKVESLG